MVECFNLRPNSQNKMKSTGLAVRAAIGRVRLTRKRDWTLEEIIEDPNGCIEQCLSCFREARLTLHSRLCGKYVLRGLLSLYQLFSSIDSDNSGSLTLAEFVAHFPDVIGQGVHSSRAFNEIDKDGSGSITFAELLVVKYPVSTRKERRFILKTLNTTAVSRELIESLMVIFLTLCHELGRKEKLKREIILAVLANSRDFFVHTVHLVSKRDINFFLEETDFDGLLHSMFRRTHTRDQINKFIDAGFEKRLETTHFSDLDLNALFSHYDSDDSGSITVEELISVCEKLGFTKSEVAQRFESLDEDNDGVVTFQEFKAFFKLEPMLGEN